jgi:F-type H+-transporting ATPase subunit gamma
MASKKDIKTRIKAVQNTQKVTRSMKLISTIKLKQVQNLNKISKTYYNQIKSLAVTSLKEFIKDFDPLSNVAKLIKPSAAAAKVLLVVISSDRGLCGPFNSQVFKLLSERYNFHKSSGKQLEIIPVGNKAINFVQKFLPEAEVSLRLSNLPTFPPLENAEEILQYIQKKVNSEECSQVELIFTGFFSMVKTVASFRQLVPYQISSKDDSQVDGLAPLTTYEPNLTQVIDKVVPEILVQEIYQAMVSSRASELSNRVNAMTAATDNAKKLIDSLTLTFNKARQAGITQEISEIVAGAESMK